MSNWDAIGYRKNSNLGQAVKLQIKFPAEKNTVTVDTDDQQFNFWWTFTNRQSKTNRQVELKDRPKNQHRRLLNWHLFTQTSFILDLTDIRSWIAFQVQLL